MEPAGIPALQDAIKHMHGCEATWLESVPVTETFEGKTVWDGEVQVFEIHDHPGWRTRGATRPTDSGGGSSLCSAWDRSVTQ